MARHIPNQQDKTPQKIIRHKLSFTTNLWQLRYRFYAIVVILMLPALLIAGDNNTKDIVPPDNGYKIVSEGLLASKVAKENKQNQYIQSQIQDSKTIALANKPSNENQEIKQTEVKPKEKILANTSVVEDGKIKAYDSNGTEITEQFTKSNLYKDFIKGTDNDQKPRVNLESIVKKPEQGLKYSYLSYPKYKIQTPIQWANFESIYQKNNQKDRRAHV